MKYELGHKGFTLIEVMMALVVLITGMVGVMGMQYMAVRGNAVSRHMRVATNLGQTQMKMLQAIPYGNLATGNDVPVLDSLTSGGMGFQRTWWVQSDCIVLALPNDDNTCNAALLPACTEDPDGNAAVLAPASAIRVRTCWTDKNGADHAVTFNDARWDS